MSDPLSTFMPVLFAIGFVYLGMPLVVLAKQKLRAHPPAVQMPSLDEVKGEDLDAGIMLERGTASLQALGFLTGLPVRVEPSAAMQGFAVVGVAPNGDVGEAYAVIQRVRDRIVRHHWITLRSFTQSFSLAVTSNAPTATGIPRPPGEMAFHALGVSDAARLRELHELCVEDAGGRRKNPPVPQDPAAYVQSETARSHDNMCAQGYAWRSGPRKETLRLTLKGAFLITWRHLPPMKQLLRRSANRRVAEMMKRLASEEAAPRAA